MVVAGAAAVADEKARVVFHETNLMGVGVTLSAWAFDSSSAADV
jgi:hypothetical protein